MIKVAGTDKPVSFITNEQNATQKKYFAKEIGCFQYGRCTGRNWRQVENADPFCTDEKTTANECPAKVITRNFRTNTDPATTCAGKTFADLGKVYPSVPPKVEYTVTDYGKTLKPLIE